MPGGAAVRQLGAQFGLQPRQSALWLWCPRWRRVCSESHRGRRADSLASALSTGAHQRYLEDPVTLADTNSTMDGNGILGHVFGSKDVSRQVAQQASQQTGIDVGILKKMLPLVAGLTMGGLSQHSQGTPGRPGLMGCCRRCWIGIATVSVVDDVLGAASGFREGRDRAGPISIRASATTAGPRGQSPPAESVRPSACGSGGVGRHGHLSCPGPSKGNAMCPARVPTRRTGPVRPRRVEMQSWVNDVGVVSLRPGTPADVVLVWIWRLRRADVLGARARGTLAASTSRSGPRAASRIRAAGLMEKSRCRRPPRRNQACR
jgi:hypothetical protein